MYGKIFKQIYESTLVEHGWEALVTFEQFIILADADGVVDMTPSALSRRTTIPLEIIQKGLDKLQLPDPLSRSQLEGGRQIVRLDAQRPWGWKIVNYQYYRNLSSKAEKREADRVRLAEKRAAEKNKNPLKSDSYQDVADCRKMSQDVAKCRNQSTDVARVANVAHAEEEEEEEIIRENLVSRGVQGGDAPQTPTAGGPEDEKKHTKQPDTGQRPKNKRERPDLETFQPGENELAWLAEQEKKHEIALDERKRALELERFKTYHLARPKSKITAWGQAWRNWILGYFAKELEKRGSHKKPSDGFLKFWATYPKKDKPGFAQNEWEKISPDAATEAMILEAIELSRLSDGWREERGKFIPDAHNWLKAKSWKGDFGKEKAMRDEEALRQKMKAMREEAERRHRQEEEAKHKAFVEKLASEGKTFDDYIKEEREKLNKKLGIQQIQAV